MSVTEIDFFVFFVEYNFESCRASPKSLLCLTIYFWTRCSSATFSH